MPEVFCLSYQTGHRGVRQHQFRLIEVVLAPLLRPFSNQRGVQSSTEQHGPGHLKVQARVMRQSAAIFQIAECRAILTTRKPRYAHMTSETNIAGWKVWNDGPFLSDWFVHHLLFLHRQLGNRLDNWTIDLYVRAGTKATTAATFLTLASDYYVDSVIGIGNTLVEKSVVMRRKSLPCTAPRIAIHWCTEPSHVATFRQTLTCNMNWISSSGLFVAYPSLTYSSSTMISPEYVPLRSDEEVQNLVTLRQGAESHGIRLAIPHADGRSRCGSLGCKLAQQGIPYVVNWFEPSVEDHFDRCTQGCIDLAVIAPRLISAWYLWVVTGAVYESVCDKCCIINVRRDGFYSGPAADTVIGTLVLTLAVTVTVFLAAKRYSHSLANLMFQQSWSRETIFADLND
ncbi:hypothetical protein K438DRAFT_1787360 [Mycena galopus ATCC 62051]|nr:hypothetical protein K438DRAFT_1787360 [Mycena galopus ATCC 62051]